MSSFGTQQKRAGGPPINLPEEALVTTVHNYHIMFSKIHANIDIRKIHGYSPLSAIIAPTWGSRVLNWCIIHQHRENEAKNRRLQEAQKSPPTLWRAPLKTIQPAWPFSTRHVGATSLAFYCKPLSKAPVITTAEIASHEIMGAPIR